MQANKSIFIRSVSNPAEARQYNAHTANTTVAKFSPSGYYIASGDASGTVRVWDAVGEDMITKGEYFVLSGRINDLAWDADSQRIIAVGDGRERYGHCFTADSGNKVGEIIGHTSVVNSVDIRPVRPYRAATVSDDSTLVFYNGPPFAFNFASKGNHSNFVNDVKFSPSGEFIVSVGSDSKIVLYDGKTGEFQKVIGEKEHKGTIFAVSWSPDSSKFVTSSADGTVKLWDVASGNVVKSWEFEKSPANQQVGVVFAGKYIISLALSGDLNFLTEDSDKPEIVLNGHQKSITALATVKGGFYTGSYDGRVIHWSEKGVATTVAGDGHSNLIAALSADDQDNVWSAGWDDILKKISDGKFSGTNNSIGGQPKALSVAKKSGAVAVVTETSLQLFENGTSKSAKLPFNATSVSITEDGSLIAVGSQNYEVHLFNGDLSPSTKLPPIRAAVTYLAFSPSGSHLAAGDATGKIALYNIADKNIQTSRWAFHTSRINSISWHSSGQYIVAGSLDTNVIVYSVEKPVKNIKFLGAHKEGVNAVAWLNDTTIVSAGSDAAVKTWAVEF